MKDNVIFESTFDAFRALSEVEDEEVANMIKPKKTKKVVEGKSFDVNSSKDMEAAGDFVKEDNSKDIQLEVIDPDANAVQHLKDKSEYVGQGIITCNKCLAPSFIDMDKLQVSDTDSDLFNVDMECPNCHSIGHGFSFVGQVGKVQPENIDDAEPVMEEPEVENDAKSEDEATVDNDFEDLPEEPVEEEPEEESKDELELPPLDDEEDDGMDTDEEDLEDEESTLGDEVDADDDLEKDEDDTVKESLELREGLTGTAKEAWLMNKVISSMGSDEAYYDSGWLYYWPDGESEEDCEWDFNDSESFDDLEKKFNTVYSEYHADGLYNPDEETIAFAHKKDLELGLPQIEVVVAEGCEEAPVEKDFSCRDVNEFFNLFSQPENMKNILVEDYSGRKQRKIYEGAFAELPSAIPQSRFKSFDVGHGNLICNIDPNNCKAKKTLGQALNTFDDAQCEKINVCDVCSSENIFTGTRDEAIKEYGDCEFVSFENPLEINIKVFNPRLHECKEEEKSKIENLISHIFKANNLSEAKITNPNTNEYWINESLKNNEDLDFVYEYFVKDSEDVDLVDEFKEITEYQDELDKVLSKYGKEIAKLEADPAVTDEALDTEEDKKEEIKEPLEKEQEKEAVKEPRVESYKSRRELAEVLTEYKNNNTPFKVSRSKKEGYRYDVTTNPITETKAKEPGDKVKSYNRGLALAKKLNKPVVYGYTTTKYGHKFFEIDEPFVYENNLNELRRKYGALVMYIAYPDKGYIDEARTSSRVMTKKLTREKPINGEVIDKPAGDVVPELSAADRKVLDKIHDIAKDISEAIYKYYDIVADDRIIVADIIQDLRLISHRIDVKDLEDTPVNKITANMFKSYEQFYEGVDQIMSMLTGSDFHTIAADRLKMAQRALFSPMFSKQAIEQGIGSPKFLEAVSAGEIPYINPNQIEEIKEGLETCECCGKPLSECNCEDCDESCNGKDCDAESEHPLDESNSTKTDKPFEFEDNLELPELEQTVDFNDRQFDRDINNYFNESYETTLFYCTETGTIDENGVITLKGSIMMNEKDNPITFTLTPSKNLNESISEQVYNVTNNLSDEKFEFTFSK